MLGLVNGTLSNDNVRFSIQNGTNQLFNVFALVLVICISIDNDVRTVSQTGIHSGHKAFCQASVFLKVHHIVDAPFLSHFYSIVLASVIDNQIFNLINAVYVLGKIVQCDLQRLCFIITWYLNNQFHFALP